MCTSCGCGEKEHVLVGHATEDLPKRPLRSAGGHGFVREVRTVRIQRELLTKNNRTAEKTRRLLGEIGVSMVNIIGAPGAGKTSLLEATIKRLRGSGLPLGVVEGDQATDLDARRIEAAGCPAFQINTGTGCHLDAAMISEGLSGLTPMAGGVLFVENVGNLVCPALFDLGEVAKVVVMSVAQGDDEPLKYSHVFHAADVCVLTKIDLLPYVPFDLDRCLANIRRVNPRLRVIQVSTLDGNDGVDEWCAWVRREASRLTGEA
jgi:hydrogenase nickel incorporation protein HypB